MPSSPLLFDLLARAGNRWRLAFAGAALVFIWKQALSKRTKLITDYASIAKEVGSDTQDFEYDYVIVGGGTNLFTHFFIFSNSELCRHRWMRACFPPLRGS